MRSAFVQNRKLFIHENASEDIVSEMTAILSGGRWVNITRCQYVELGELKFSPEETSGYKNSLHSTLEPFYWFQGGRKQSIDFKNGPSASPLQFYSFKQQIFYAPTLDIKDSLTHSWKYMGA